MEENGMRVEKNRQVGGEKRKEKENENSGRENGKGERREAEGR